MKIRRKSNSINTNENENEENFMERNNSNDDNDTLSQQLSVDLLQRMRNYMKSFDMDISIIQSIEQSMVSVSIVDDMVLAEVFCAVCQNDRTKKRKINGKRVFYKGGEGSKYWVLSNFGQHLKNVHKLNSRSRANESIDVAQEEKETKNGSLLTDGVVDAVPENNVPCTSVDTGNNIPKELNDEKLALAHNFSVEYIDIELKQKTNVSEVMYSQISSQITRMLEKTLLNNDDTTEMSVNLKKSMSLKIAEIDRDGNCLFSSIVHQLFCLKLQSDEHSQETKQLRKNVVEYISSHYSSFKFALQGRVYEEINPQSIRDMDKECKSILNDYLPRDYVFWGGAESLKAIQGMYHVNILTFEENGLCSFNENFDTTYPRTLILAFRSNRPRKKNRDSMAAYNHYDSVCDISSNAILNSISHLAKAYENSNTVFDTTL